MDLPEFTIAEAQAAFERGEWTSASLTESYLRRVSAIDSSGPMLRSMIEINPDAMTIADGLDAERRRGRTRGPLHGIPIVVKDSIDTADKMVTSAGSLALEHNVAPQDSFLMGKLRAAGVVRSWARRTSVRSASWPSSGPRSSIRFGLVRFRSSGTSNSSSYATASR